MKPSSHWPSEAVMGHLPDVSWGPGGVIMPRGRGSDDSLLPRCVDASAVPIRYLRAIVEVTHLWKKSCICVSGAWAPGCCHHTKMPAGPDGIC